MNIKELFQLTISIILSITCIASLFMIGLYTYKVYKELNFKRKFEENKFNIEYKITDDDIKLLDRLIQERVDIYKIYKIEGNNIKYITEAIQNDMIKFILKDVIRHISPIYYSKLKYIYNEDIIEDIILEKIRMHVLEYTIEVNGSYAE